MISSTPPSPPAPTGPGYRVPRGGVSPRKVILGIILAGSSLFFFLIIFATGIAILAEAAPVRRSAATTFVSALKRIILHFAHHI